MAYTRVSPGRAFASTSTSLLLRGAILTGLVVVPQSAKAQTSLPGVISGCDGVPPQATIQADSSNYQAALGGLAPGDRLLLAASTYPNGLSVSNVHGASNQCIVIEGPATGPRAVFTGRNCCNTVSIRDSSYVIIRNLELDGSGGYRRRREGRVRFDLLASPHAGEPVHSRP